MSSFFNCAAYDDVETTIRLNDHVVFLALEDKEKNTSIHLTLNPFQIRTLAKYLSVALAQIEFKTLSKLFRTKITSATFLSKSSTRTKAIITPITSTTITPLLSPSKFKRFQSPDCGNVVGAHPF